MTLKVAVQMDPIESINIRGDSTFAMMLEAQARGHSLFYYQTRTLALGGGSLFAAGHDIAVRDEAGNHFTLGESRRIDLGQYDVVLMRQDPPFDMGYITATHLLDHIHPKTLVVNDPAEVRNAPEKLYVLRYPQFMPDTLITRDPAEIAAFRRTHGDIILKPLYGNGGAGVFRLGEEDQNFSSLLELFTQAFREPFIAQQYLPMFARGTSASFSSTARSPAPSTGCPPPMRAAPTCMSAGARAHYADNAGARDLRGAGPGSQGARSDLRGDRCDR